LFGGYCVYIRACSVVVNTDRYMQTYHAFDLSRYQSPVKARKQAIGRAAALHVFCLLRRFLADFKLRQNASGVRPPLSTSTPPRRRISRVTTHCHCLAFSSPALPPIVISPAPTARLYRPVLESIPRTNRRPAERNSRTRTAAERVLYHEALSDIYRSEFRIQAHTLAFQIPHLLKT